MTLRRRRMLATLLALALCLSLLPMSALAAEAIATTEGGLTVSGGEAGTDYTYQDNTLTIKTGKELTVSGMTTTDQIVVNGGVTANLTLNGVSIAFENGNVTANDQDDTRAGTCALSLGEGSTLNLTLAGENTLQSGAGRAGIFVPQGSTLTIGGEGTLNVTGGRLAAGIGGDLWHNAGTITIENGSINATGGSNAAAIGGGHANDGLSQQYGGFTVPSVDLILEPYAEKSYRRALAKYDRLGVAADLAEKEALADVKKEFEQGFQGWEYKFNTVASSRGDYPFITVTAGTGTGQFARMASVAMLEVRRGGQGKTGHKKPVLFPKIVFLYDENLHGPGKPLEDVFEAGVACSAKTMYPDWLSLTGKGYVASMYKKYGKIISPMGCRAFLSPWYEQGGMHPAFDGDEPVFVGRFNIGVVSLHLPMILAKARKESRDFYEVLDYYLELIRRLHIRTYAYLGEMRASTNPLAYCEGGFYGGHLKLTDKIKPVLKTATASFGITALNELQMLYNGKSLVEDGAFALEVMEHINKRVDEFKEEDGNLYAIYGTPAENLCGLQIRQFREQYGIIEGVSDRPYVSNSFHCHVSEDITPIQKQDLENRFWNLSNGGKIQYVKYPIGYNTLAIKSLIRRAMDMGFYEGVNLSLSYCDDCGHEELQMDVCPKCGSKNLTKIDRMNGYLSYSRVHGDTRLNAAKMAEIADRKSM